MSDLKNDLESMLDAIRSEMVDHAERKFPEFPTDPVHAAAIVGEEGGELLASTLQATYEGKSMERAIAEAIDTGAMALRFLVMVDQMEPRPSPQAKRITKE